MIAVVGDVMLDQYVKGSVTRISPEAPVPVLHHKENFTVPGGAANLAMNIAAMGGFVSVVGVTGNDPAGEELRNSIRAYPGVIADGLVQDETRPTITKMRLIAGRQQLLRIDKESMDGVSGPVKLELEKAAIDAVSHSEIVVLSDYAKGVLSQSLIDTIVAKAGAMGVPVLVDPKRNDFRAYTGANLITPNRAELQMATGLPTTTDKEVCRAAKHASSQFGGDVLVTRSERGMTLWRKNSGAIHIPSESLEVADVSGAGDTALAALTVWLWAGYPIEEAVKIANKAAGIAVSRLGTTVVTRDDIEKALAPATSHMLDHGRIVSQNEAMKIAAFWRRNHEQVVFTNGCFDLLHPGHIRLLDLAAAEGDRLIVALNSDASVRRLKGPSRPVQDEGARARVIGSLRPVDLVVTFDEDTPRNVIEAIKPDVLVKGADYTEDQVVGGDFVKTYGGRVVLIPLVPDKSTTALVTRMRL